MDYLVEKGVSLVGCDTLAVDAFGSEEIPSHYTLLGNEVHPGEPEELGQAAILATFHGVPAQG